MLVWGQERLIGFYAKFTHPRCQLCKNRIKQAVWGKKKGKKIQIDRSCFIQREGGMEKWNWNWMWIFLFFFFFLVTRAREFLMRIWIRFKGVIAIVIDGLMEMMRDSFFIFAFAGWNANKLNKVCCLHICWELQHFFLVVVVDLIWYRRRQKCKRCFTAKGSLQIIKYNFLRGQTLHKISREREF